MSESRPIIIPLSKSKLLLVVAGSLVFVALGIWFVLWPNSDERYEPGYVEAVGIVTLGFFGPCGIYGVSKMLDTRPGLILDRDGITDNSSALAVGRVPWSDIYDVRVSAASRQRFLTLLLRDPERYLRRFGVLRRFLKAGSIEMTGSPMNISAGTLRIDFDELERLVRGHWLKYGGAKSDQTAA